VERDAAPAFASTPKPGLLRYFFLLLGAAFFAGAFFATAFLAGAFFAAGAAFLGAAFLVAIPLLDNT
jgi:hypothetical protein